MRFDTTFPDRELESITAEEILLFLNQISPAANQTTKRLRYSLLKAFYNFCKNTLDETIANPCATSMLKKMFRDRRGVEWTIVEKEVIDEIIFKTKNHRDRLILELMARGGMRISEVLKLTARDVEDRKLILHNPKSGKGVEVVYIPQKVAVRLKDYIRNNQITLAQRIFPITYSGAMSHRKKGRKCHVGIAVKTHDFWRHAATFVSRYCATSIEIVSKVILRHANLATTQRYLGKVSDTEAVRWIENLYG